MNSESRVALTVRQSALLGEAHNLLDPIMDPNMVAKMTVMDLISKDAAYAKLMEKMASIHLKDKQTTEPVCALVVIHCERHNLVGITDGARGMYQHNLFDIAKKTI